MIPAVPNTITGFVKKATVTGRALRGLADRLLALLCAMLKSHTLYDPATHFPTAGSANSA
jgi:hypothetical protein